MFQIHLLLNLFHSSLLQIVEEAGGMVTRMDGGKFCVFDRSILVSNGVLHEKVSYAASHPPNPPPPHTHTHTITII